MRDLLSEGFGLLKKYGLYRDEGKYLISSLSRMVRDLELNLDTSTPEAKASARALYEANRLISFRDTKIDGKRILLSDYFIGLSIKLLLPLRNTKLIEAVCKQISRIGIKDDTCFPQIKVQNTDISAFCVEDTAVASANNKLIQALKKDSLDIAAQETMRALSSMEEVFRSRFNRLNVSEMDATIYGALMGGGKRLRPILLYLSSGFGSPVEEEQMAQMMSAVELIHAASLVHDDIVDQSPLRHGKPTISETKGDVYAARCGFQMVIAALELMSETEVDIALADIPLEMCLGELRQIDVEFKPEMQTEEDYYLRVTRKTAKLIEGACRVGGIASKAGKETIKVLSEFGHALGTLFQLRDDLLDYWQWDDEGKPVLQDIERGIYSLPLLYALKSTDEKSREGSRLRRLLRQSTRTPDEVRYLLEAAECSGGINYAAGAIESQADRAYKALSKLPPCWQRDGLECLLNALAGDVLEYCSLNLRAEKRLI